MKVRRVVVGVAVACSLVGVLFTVAGPVRTEERPVLFAEEPTQPDGTIPDPMCLYYILFGIPIPSWDCFF